MWRRWLTAILVVTLLASSWAALGPWGIVAAAYLLGILAALRSWRVRSKNVWTLLAILLLAVLSFFFLMPAVASAPAAGRLAQCGSNLHQIGLALLNYEKQNGCFPPAYVCDKDGKPMHSWRVLILPYLEMKPLYDMYDFNEPWDGPNNRLLAQYMPTDYTCPAATRAGANSPPMTSYVVVRGPETAFPGCQSRGLSQFTAGTVNTVLLVEVANSDTNWMEPRDPSIDDLGLAGDVCRPLSSHHLPYFDYWHYAQPGSGNVVCADASTHYLPGPISADDAKRILSIHADVVVVYRWERVCAEASKSLTIRELKDRPLLVAGLRWDHVVGLPVFCLSLVGLVVLALTHRRRDAQPAEPSASEVTLNLGR